MPQPSAKLYASQVAMDVTIGASDSSTGAAMAIERINPL